MKTSDRVNFMNSLEIAQSRTVDAELTNNLINSLIHEGFCFSRPAPAWGIATVPNHDPRVQVEFDGDNVHFTKIGPVEGHNSFPLTPDVSVPFSTADDVPQAINSFRFLFFSALNES